MRLEEPAWWYGKTSQNAVWPKILDPVGQLYGWTVKKRFEKANPYKSKKPIICIGNLTAGGSGKTPFAIFVATRLVELHNAPVFLTRGYKGQEQGPLTVDPKHHTPIDIGDEPFLLAEVCPTIVSKDRVEGVKFIEKHVPHATHIIMDDGFQNPAVEKDLSIVVIDGNRGIGNGRIIPAGPLRASLPFQLHLADAVLISGATEQGQNDHLDSDNQHSSTDTPTAQQLLQRYRREFRGPVLTANVEPLGNTEWIKGSRLIAYAGIANPSRFYTLLSDLGANLIDTISFPDHHLYTKADIENLFALARANDANLITTKKDFVRLSESNDAERDLRKASLTLEVVFSVKDPSLERLNALLNSLDQ